MKCCSSERCGKKIEAFSYLGSVVNKNNKQDEGSDKQEMGYDVLTNNSKYWYYS